jgi:uncharacterized protein (DUF1778 family)
MTNVSGRELRIPLRVKPEEKALIEQGARARGLTVTDFLLTNGLREAESALCERILFALDEESYTHFMSVLERPARTIPEISQKIDKNRSSKWKVMD